MTETVKIVVIRSLSYTGTTWINLILGSHKRGIALGPPLRVWELKPEDADKACMIHRNGCRFWSPFIRDWDRKKSFFLQLSQYSGKDIIVLNNPLTIDKREFKYPGLKVKYIHVVRDGRANVVSLMRHLPDRYESTYEAVYQWQRKFTIGMINAMSMLPADDVYFLRYEDAVLNPDKMFKEVGEFIGTEYPENALRFWEFEQHAVAGNAGTIDMLRQLQGQQANDHLRKEVYDKIIDETKRRPDVRVLDESWRDTLGLEDRFAYDYLMGDIHEQLGYQRDSFNIDQIRHCLKVWGLKLNPKWLPRKAPKHPVHCQPMANDAVNLGTSPEVLVHREINAMTSPDSNVPINARQ